MGRKMDRNKRTILFEHLPGQTYDFERTGVIARTREIRATKNTELNLQLVLEAIERVVRAWPGNHRRQFPDSLSSKASSFVLVEPLSASAEMFPMMMWCQNRRCGRVFDRSRPGSTFSSTCPVCKTGRLIQLPFIQVHRCGALRPLNPYCRKCKSSANMALDKRGSERLSNFQWICRKCNTTEGVFGMPCPECTWDTPVPNVNNPRMMNIDVHRAGKTFYPHYVTLLNQPRRELNTFLDIPEWPEIAAAAYLEFPELHEKRLLDFARYASVRESSETAFDLSESDKAALKAQGYSDTQIEDFRRMQAQLKPKKIQEHEALTPTKIAASLVERTGVPHEVWIEARQDMIETVLPTQSGDIRQLFENQDPELDFGREVASRAGLGRVTLIADFPITTVTYGYSRVDYRPNLCDVRPFPPDRDHGNKFPIFVDLIQADAVMLRLDSERVCKWLELNGFPVNLPEGTGSEEMRRQAYFVQLFSDILLRDTITANNPQARMVFCLLHSLSHLCVRRAALLCGLDRTSLSEYVLPRSLSFAVYSSHRFGATIGALTALFEQSLADWLNQVLDSRKCVYDPVCTDQGGNCHACMHLSEISCQFFNMNLGRSFLFGGRDKELGEIKFGYFDPTF